MKKKDFIDLGIDEELSKKAAEASASELEGFIPKSRFDSVNEAKKQAEEQVKAHEKQLNDLKKAAKGNEDLQAEIQKLQDINDNTTKEYKSKLEKLKIDTAIDLAFGDLPETKRKAAKAFIDREKLKLTEDGKVSGLEDQVKGIKESEDTSFLYADSKKSFKGIRPGEPKGDPKGGEPESLKSAIAAHYNN